MSAGKAPQDGGIENKVAMRQEPTESMLERYERRRSKLYQLLRPPLPLVSNQREARLPSCTGTKLFVGAAGGNVASSFVTLDIVPFAGVDVVADIHQLPFADDSISGIECDAVLEHVERPIDAVRECWRVLRRGGYLHVVVPFCHPFHQYPRDYQRWTADGLTRLLGGFQIMSVGLRTGPTATLLTFFLEYVKVLSPGPLKKPAYAIMCWLLWPLRYLDLWLNRKTDALGLANHIYALAQKA